MTRFEYLIIFYLGLNLVNERRTTDLLYFVVAYMVLTAIDFIAASLRQEHEAKELLKEFKRREY